MGPALYARTCVISFHENSKVHCGNHLRRAGSTSHYGRTDGMTSFHAQSPNRVKLHFLPLYMDFPNVVRWVFVRDTTFPKPTFFTIWHVSILNYTLLVNCQTGPKEKARMEKENSMRIWFVSHQGQSQKSYLVVG